MMPRSCPRTGATRTSSGDRSHYARQVCDFLSGMTDRFALEQHKRLFDLDPLFR